MNESLRKLCMKLVRGGLDDTSGSSSFPGALPINFGRRYWKVIDLNEQFHFAQLDLIRDGSFIYNSWSRVRSIMYLKKPTDCAT